MGSANDGGKIMKIESISRKISGFNYDNISVVATVDENDNAIEVAKELDILLHKMLNEIENQSKTIHEAKREKKIQHHY